MKNKINIAKWNASGIMSSAPYANDFLKIESVVLGCLNIGYISIIYISYKPYIGIIIVLACVIMI